MDDFDKILDALKFGVVGYMLGLIFGLWLIPILIVIGVLVLAWYENR